MQIRTKLMASAFMPLGLLVLIGLTILFTNNLLKRVEKAERAAVEVRTKVSFLNASINYYLLRHEESTKTQIQKIDASLTAVLTDTISADPHEEAILRSLRYNHDAVKSLLSRLTGLWENDSRKSRELEERLTSYVLERTREMAADTMRYESIMDKKLALAHRRANLLIMVFAGLISTVILAVSLLTSKRISTALHKLRRGTRIVSEGDLDYKISVTAHDELAQLSEDFNAMSGKLRESYAALRQEVIDRTTAEQAAEEYAAQLEVSNRELEDFAFVASHDLQEPLRKIQAFGDRLKLSCGGNLGPEERDYLERMQKASARMQALIFALLNYSRVSTKAKPFTPTDLTEVAHTAVGDLVERIRETEGLIEIEQLATIDADPIQMGQLFQNLIGNALKFHGEERPKVKIYGLPEDGDGDAGKKKSRARTYRIFVEDNGIGFDEKYLDRIFTPFQRLHGRGVYEGTGIGLAICRKITERHGGTITARSTPGKGSTFVVTLPIKRSKGGQK